MSTSCKLCERTRPAGRARSAVRGLAASMPESMRRLAHMPAVRAPNIASVTQNNVHQPGKP
jgi:hypothetical protein